MCEQRSFRVGSFEADASQSGVVNQPAEEPDGFMSEAQHTQPRPFAPAPVHSDCILAIADEQDRTSFAALFHHFAPRLKTYLLRLGMPATVAEELVQETMLLVWRKAGQFDPSRATPSAWIYTIARNLRIDTLRRERYANDPRLSEPEETACSPEQELDLIESGQRVRHALDGLPSEQAALLRLSYFEDRSHAEIADQLQLPLGTVKSRLRRAAAQLREILSDR